MYKLYMCKRGRKEVMEQISSNLQTFLPPSPTSSSPAGDRRRAGGSLDIANEKSRSVKMCYFLYKLLVVLFTVIGLLILLFLKDLTDGEQKMLNILREIRSSTIIAAAADSNLSQSG